MLSTLRLPLIRSMGNIVFVTVCSIALQAAAPSGWLLSGGSPTEFECGIDSFAAHNGHPSAYLKSKSPFVQGFGTLMQDFRAEHYTGKRVRFSAFVRTENVQRAGLWMRIDMGSKTVAFDNMQSRPIKGTTDWQQYDVVLNVPQDATDISFGALLIGSGEMWLNGAQFQVVGPRTLTTNGDVVEKPGEPTNLDFEQ